MNNPQFVMSIIFVLTVIYIIWRPRGHHETFPATVSACIILVLGIVPLVDVHGILGVVSGAAITILSTIVMSIVLESIGFFRWAAINLAIKSKGSGIILFWNINLLCFLMTLFFNNDGSILITTPIIFHTLKILHFKPHQMFPYFISGALVATGSSAPIGVSNLANLIALKIVGLDLNTYAAMMFVPSMAGIICIVLLLLLYFRKSIPNQFTVDQKLLMQNHAEKRVKNLPHPLAPSGNGQATIDWNIFRICLIIVILTRISFFALAPLGVPTEWPAVAGAVLLILTRWYKNGTGAVDILKKSPWHILLFAFSMYVIVQGLHNSGLTDVIIEQFGPVAREGPSEAIFVFGLLLTVLSNICNNLPSIMIGTLSITETGLDLQSMQTAYLGSVLGADIGALILPIGTLATLIWTHMLRQYHIAVSWAQYLKVTIFVIPVSLVISLLSLHFWTKLFFV